MKSSAIAEPLDTQLTFPLYKRHKMSEAALSLTLVYPDGTPRLLNPRPLAFVSRDVKSRYFFISNLPLWLSKKFVSRSDPLTTK